MTKFDDQIDWCQKRREVAAEDIKDFEEAGQRISRDGVDITDRMIARAKSDIELFDRLIAAYKKHEAEKS